ncbi:MAG: rhamnulokinase [Candidatus Omnitrophica bacterium]|nr:rhamnulokinase [Candidatus Omnitrophota bacterium]
MKAKNKIIGAFDIGASGGKFIVGIFDEGKFSTKEVYRFINKPINLYLRQKKDKTVHKIYWNDLSIYDEIITGLKKLKDFGIEHLDSLGIDTWGTDGECFTKEGELIGRVHNYRDHRLDKIRDELFKIIPERKLFELTGVPSYPFNEVNQLFWLVKHRPDILKMVDIFLPITSIFYYYLSGARICEYTWATTTQLLDPFKKDWCKKVFEKLKIPLSIMPPVTTPGTKIGSLHQEIAKEVGLNQCSIIATAAHDTACAYAAAPIEKEENSLIISSGTWSLVGKLIPSPLINEKIYQNHFTNEGGIGNIRFLKNVMGAWIIQELRRSWKERDKRELSWDEIVKMAKKGERFSAIIDPDNNIFYNPENMEKAIKDFCKKTGQKIPRNRETTLRIVYESLALKYRRTNEMIEEITEKKNSRVYVIGGGANNPLLNQFTAEATGLPVIAGPIEATAIGNILIQAKTLGTIKSIEEGRRLVKGSFPLAHYKPKDILAWKKAVKKFKKIF